jgi:hypothetical protein
MVDGAFAIVSSDLPATSEKELTRHLWRLDAHEVQLEGMRDSITKELEGYDRDAVSLQQPVSAQSATVVAKLNEPDNIPG